VKDFFYFGIQAALGFLKIPNTSRQELVEVVHQLQNKKLYTIGENPNPRPVHPDVSRKTRAYV
jgi:hypothetical protein